MRLGILFHVEVFGVVPNTRVSHDADRALQSLDINCNLRFVSDFQRGKLALGRVYDIYKDGMRHNVEFKIYRKSSTSDLLHIGRKHCNEDPIQLFRSFQDVLQVFYGVFDSFKSYNCTCMHYSSLTLVDLLPGSL